MDNTGVRLSAESLRLALISLDAQIADLLETRAQLIGIHTNLGFGFFPGKWAKKFAPAPAI